MISLSLCRGKKSTAKTIKLCDIILVKKVGQHIIFDDDDVMSFTFSVNLLLDMEIVILITVKGIQQQRIYIHPHTHIHKIEEKFMSIKIIYSNKT
jgi:hypothetical protein